MIETTYLLNISAQFVWKLELNDFNSFNFSQLQQQDESEKYQ